VGPETPTAHCPSPRQNVEDEALVPLFKLVTGKLPVTLDAKFTNCVDVVPVPPLAIGNVPVTLEAKLTNCVDVVPVPPLAIGSVPVTPVERGKPVALVNVTLEGVPSAGVTSVGLLDNTTEPEPVEVVVPVPPFATGNVPVTLVAKLTKVVDVEPVPPEVIGNAVPRAKVDK
jgi:hypothetical protein